jgi:hypothetical protein
MHLLPCILLPLRLNPLPLNILTNCSLLRLNPLPLNILINSSLPRLWLRDGRKDLLPPPPVGLSALQI